MNIETLRLNNSILLRLLIAWWDETLIDKYSQLSVLGTGGVVWHTYTVYFIMKHMCRKYFECLNHCISCGCSWNNHHRKWNLCRRPWDTCHRGSSPDFWSTSNHGLDIRTLVLILLSRNPFLPCWSSRGSAIIADPPAILWWRPGHLCTGFPGTHYTKRLKTDFNVLDKWWQHMYLRN